MYLYLMCFCIVPFMFIYSYLLLVQGLLPPSENSIAVNDDDDDDDDNIVGHKTVNIEKYEDKKLFLLR